LSTGQCAIWVASREGLAQALALVRNLAASPWEASGVKLAQCDLYAPERFADGDCIPCSSLAESFRARFFAYQAHVLFGAVGIAVRFVAPVLAHKSVDPPVVVIDNKARFVISLLAGHWGGGNRLARHLALLLHATPVITTASDTCVDSVALDLVVQQAGLCLLDWQELPGIQGRLLDGQCLSLYDPFQALPRIKDLFCPIAKASLPSQFPQITVHWQDLPAYPQRLRIVIPHLVCGVGFRKSTEPELFAQAFTAFSRQYGFSLHAVTALATIDAKACDAGLCSLARTLQVPLEHFSAEVLAREPGPHPSEMAGKVFGQPPFSVSEAAALISAGQRYSKTHLFFPKTCFFGKITLAAAGSAAFLASEPLFCSF